MIQMIQMIIKNQKCHQKNNQLWTVFHDHLFACVLSFLNTCYLPLVLSTLHCLCICMYTQGHAIDRNLHERTRVLLLGSGWETFSASNLRSKSPLLVLILQQSQQVASTSSSANKTKIQVPMLTVLRTFHKSSIFFYLPHPLPDKQRMGDNRQKSWLLWQQVSEMPQLPKQVVRAGVSGPAKTSLLITVSVHLVPAYTAHFTLFA